MMDLRAKTAAMGSLVYAYAQRVVGALNLYYLRISLYLDQMAGRFGEWVRPPADRGQVIINNVRYAWHALARMAPVGTRWWDPVKRVYIEGRGVPTSVVQNAILYGQRIAADAPDKIWLVYENVNVLMNTATNTVITVLKTSH